MTRLVTTRALPEWDEWLACLNQQNVCLLPRLLTAQGCVSRLPPTRTRARLMADRLQNPVSPGGPERRVRGGGVSRQWPVDGMFALPSPSHCVLPCMMRICR